MLISRSTGSASVAPELVYPDVEQAVGWLCDTFGFVELWRAGEHRARLAFDNGVIILADADPQYGRAAPKGGELRSHAVMVKVEDVDAHHERALQRGARILSPPTDYAYGERQYSVEDLAGHRTAPGGRIIPTCTLPSFGERVALALVERIEQPCEQSRALLAYSLSSPAPFAGQGDRHTSGVSTWIPSDIAVALEAVDEADRPRLAEAEHL
jgi:uncharacterized glyoxalase superfamily protein PhnB